MRYFPKKNEGILALALPPPTIPWLYQIFCEKSTKYNSNSKASSIGNSNMRTYSNSNRQITPSFLFHPAPRKNNLKGFSKWLLFSYLLAIVNYVLFFLGAKWYSTPMERC